MRAGKNCITRYVCYVQSGLETLKQCIDCCEGWIELYNKISLLCAVWIRDSKTMYRLLLGLERTV
jgi:hypothetical protein